MNVFRVGIVLVLGFVMLVASGEYQIAEAGPVWRVVTFPARVVVRGVHRRQDRRAARRAARSCGGVEAAAGAGCHGVEAAVAPAADMET